MKLWDVATHVALHTLEQEGTRYASRFLRTASSLPAEVGHSVKLWDVASGTPIATLPHRQEVASVAFSPDGKMLAVGCGTFIGGEIKLWNSSLRAELHTFSGHTA